ncbi:MAG: HTH domain-containing protein [Phycisphaerae bacterium]
MAKNVKNRADFTETFTVHASLRLARKQKLFAKDAKLQKTADRLIHELEGDRTIYGRQLRMVQLMQRGASVDSMGRKLRCSRRTVFRYLNHLEEAGVQITLDGSKYTVSGRLLKNLPK